MAIGPMRRAGGTGGGRADVRRPRHGAEAHPHVCITFETTVLYDKGTFAGVRHKWTFDEFYTTMAIEGLDKNKDGIYDREELAELAKVNIEGLKDFAYFTFPALAGKEMQLGEARDYWLEHKDGLLSLHFTLPFASPVLSEAKGLTISVYDPDLLHRLRAGQDQAGQAQRRRAQGVRGQGCGRRREARRQRRARSVADAARRLWLQHRQDHRRGMQRALTMSSGFASLARAGRDPGAGRARVRAAAGAGQEPIRRGAPAPRRASCRRGRAPSRRSPPVRCSVRRPGCWRSRRSSIASLRRPCAASRRPSPLSATLMLAALSFAYGVLHAAGPGHGKAVISSYVLADGRTVRRGILLAFLAALIQALSALVAGGRAGAGAARHGAADPRDGGLARDGELGAGGAGRCLAALLSAARRPSARHGARRHATITPIARMTMLTGRATPPFARAARHITSTRMRTTTPARCARTCPAPAELQGDWSWRRALALAFAVGIRPCTGAILVLVFAIGQGLLWAGVLSTFAMALGTAITVSVLAASAVGFRELAARLAGGGIVQMGGPRAAGGRAGRGQPRAGARCERSSWPRSAPPGRFNLIDAIDAAARVPFRHAVYAILNLRFSAAHAGA